MYDNKSHYALNKKDPDALVYTDADRHIIRLTRDDFDTEADFLKWKAWSDENYHDVENGNHVEANHSISYSSIMGRDAAVDGPEIIIEQRIEKQEKERYTAETIVRVKGQLTEKQFQRLWMNCVNGMTTRKIAQLEGKTHQGISKSIRAAKRKILKLFQNR